MSAPVTLRGIVKDNVYKDSNGHPKRIVTLLQKNNHVAYIEFRGGKMDLLNLVEIDDEVRVVITVEGKLSGSTGVHYNNLVAQNIT